MIKTNIDDSAHFKVIFLPNYNSIRIHRNRSSERNLENLIVRLLHEETKYTTKKEVALAFKIREKNL